MHKQNNPSMQHISSLIRRISGIVIVTFCCVSAQAQWAYVGPPGFSLGLGSYQSMVVGSDGTPYVAYNDQSFPPSGKAVVMKFDDTNWVAVGMPGFTVDMAEQGCLAIDTNDSLYFSFQDQSNSGRVSVMKFNGSSWTYVGQPGFSNGSATCTSLRADTNNVLYCAYVDGSSGRAVVKTFNGVSWVAVGPSAEVSGSGANYTSLQIDPVTNAPWVVFTDAMASNNATVMKYDGISWVTVGASGFSNSPSGVLQTDIALDAAGTAYVGYWDPFNALKAAVRKFNGTSWDTVGTPFISQGQVYFTSLVVDASGIPYISYMDYTVSGNAATTMRYDPSTTSWVSLGAPGYSGSNPGYLESAIDGNNSIYVTSLDGSNGNKVSVMKYAFCAQPVISSNGAVLTSTSASAYQWYVNQSLIPGANGQSHTATQSGWYFVTATDTNGCSATSDSVFILISGTEEPAAGLVKLYPTLFSGTLQLSLHFPGVHDWQLCIADMTGRAVYNHSGLQHNMILDLHSLAPGVYAVILSNGAERVVRKVMKQ